MDATGFSLPDPFSLIIILVSLSMAPFVAIMVSSFVKLVVVLSLIRNALGVQQVPPNMVINGLAIILTFYIMTPVIQDTYNILDKEDLKGKSIEELLPAFAEAKAPLQHFLMRHSTVRDRQFFMASARTLWPEEQAAAVQQDDFMILVPAYTVSELTSAFQIGFLIYLPFIVVDLIVSNILLAMGMMMVSPMTISLPFKLLLFVLVSGWSRLIQGIVLTYS